MKTLYIAKKSTIEWIKDKLFLISFLNIRETVVYGRKIWIMPRTTWTTQMGKKLLKHSPPIISAKYATDSNENFHKNLVNAYL